MASERTLYSGRRQEAFYSLKGWSPQDRRWMGGRKMNQKTQQEGQEIFDLKSLTTWLEEHFIDFVSSKMG